MRFPRYANIDVSYLLERMEAVGDLAILATNRKNAPDQTFLLGPYRWSVGLGEGTSLRLELIIPVQL